MRLGVPRVRVRVRVRVRARARVRVSARARARVRASHCACVQLDARQGGRDAGGEGARVPRGGGEILARYCPLPLPLVGSWVREYLEDEARKANPYP